MARYYGDEDTHSRAQVVRYLTQNFADAEGNFLPEDLATQLVVTHKDIVDKGISYRSHVSYIGDRILEAEPSEKYNWVEEDEEDEDG